ncbi:DUF433 domain-containing protein [candidate division KSB1 bacterium]|nr:DUF433 domain-containing protein [candidate division KSB1 bacterium]MBL7093298.1 DUF433 domain-containing protein [candidate division KSB1 bacterium]
MSTNNPNLSELSNKSLLDRITIDPNILAGKPIIRGMRISAEQILKALSRGMTHKEILSEFPVLEEDDIKAVLQYAYEIISVEKIYPLKQVS